MRSIFVYTAKFIITLISEYSIIAVKVILAGVN